ncbi:MAG: serine/threonine protein kinase [Chloroflexaceae bacterium]|nr:serine/threonine protein kinase [Chloroflexaceae bacterium]
MSRKSKPPTTILAPDPLQTHRLPTVPAAPSCGVQVGDVLEQRYQIDTLIGWGGHAVVFAATDLQRKRQLAIKVLRCDLAEPAYRDAVEVLRHESRLLRRLRHPALPRLACFASTSTSTWMARDMIAGTPLSHWTTYSPRGAASLCDPEVVHGWALQLCDLLRYLHTQSPPVLCNDLKPANLILRSDGTLALIDLGAALTYTRTPPRKRRPRFGTPGYASPEQLRRDDLDERSDLFSLGVVCYELLTGIDPTAEPLQFNWHELHRRAPRFANTLRWALTLEPQQRAPTAAALYAALSGQHTPTPLVLGYGVQISTRAELLTTAMRHPRLIEDTIASRALDTWLATHPDAELGHLLHHLRAARRTATARQRQIDIFFHALAPAEGSAQLRPLPDRLQFGAVPLKHWRLWSHPQTLTLQNTTRQPLRWQLECPTQRGAEVRVWQDGKARRQTEGVLPPGTSTELLLVAAGKQGKQQGTLTLRCGDYETYIPWEANALAGIPFGPQQLVATLADLDLTAPNIIPRFELLLERDILGRWLRAQGERELAASIERAYKQAARSPFTQRQAVVQLFHHLDPHHFPLLDIQQTHATGLDVMAGDSVTTSFEITNRGDYPCSVSLISPIVNWVTMPEVGMLIPAGETVSCSLNVAPPASYSDYLHQVELELWSGRLMLPLSLSVQVLARHWWRRALRWLMG